MTTPSEQRPVPYTVVGAGAIGGTLAFHLARAGHPVTVVDADRDHIHAVATRGLRLLRDATTSTVTVAAAMTPDASPPDHAEAQLGRVLLAVKAQATGPALDWIAPRLRPDGFVVSLQNGLNEPVIAERIGAERTVGAFVNLFADVTAPGEIRDGGLGALVVGEMNGSVSDRVRSVVQDLHAWGPARVTDNVAGFLWSKLGFGAMLTATALADAPMADLIDANRAVMYRLTAEVFDVSEAMGIRLEAFDAFDPLPYAGDDQEEKDKATDRLVSWLRTQPKDRSGIWRDLAVRRRPTEVPTHYEAMLREADRLAVPTPMVRELLRQIRHLEDGDAMSTERISNLLGVTA